MYIHKRIYLLRLLIFIYDFYITVLLNGLFLKKRGKIGDSNLAVFVFSHRLLSMDEKKAEN